MHEQKTLNMQKNMLSKLKCIKKEKIESLDFWILSCKLVNSAFSFEIFTEMDLYVSNVKTSFLTSLECVMCDSIMNYDKQSFQILRNSMHLKVSIFNFILIFSFVYLLYQINYRFSH